MRRLAIVALLGSVVGATIATLACWGFFPELYWRVTDRMEAIKRDERRKP